MDRLPIQDNGQDDEEVGEYGQQDDADQDQRLVEINNSLLAVLSYGCTGCQIAWISGL